MMSRPRRGFRSPSPSCINYKEQPLANTNPDWLAYYAISIPPSAVLVEGLGCLAFPFSFIFHNQTKTYPDWI